MLLPTGRSVSIDPKASGVALHFLSAGPREGCVTKRQVADLQFVATDLDSSFGEGPFEVRGSSMALITAMTGRDALASQLAGAGVATLLGGD